jgi:hypothetical protein
MVNTSSRNRVLANAVGKLGVSEVALRLGISDLFLRQYIVAGGTPVPNLIWDRAIEEKAGLFPEASSQPVSQYLPPANRRPN